MGKGMTLIPSSSRRDLGISAAESVKNRIFAVAVSFHDTRRGRGPPILHQYYCRKPPACQLRPRPPSSSLTWELLYKGWFAPPATLAERNDRWKGVRWKTSRDMIRRWAVKSPLSALWIKIYSLLTAVWKSMLLRNIEQNFRYIFALVGRGKVVIDGELIWIRNNIEVMGSAVF